MLDDSDSDDYQQNGEIYMNLDENEFSEISSFYWHFKELIMLNKNSSKYIKANFLISGFNRKYK